MSSPGYPLNYIEITGFNPKEMFIIIISYALLLGYSKADLPTTRV